MVYTLIWEDWTHTQTHTHTHTHAHTRTHTHAHARTHRHTHARRRGSARQLTCRDAGAASRFVTETGQSASAQGEFYECVNVGDNFPCLKYFIAVIPNRYLRKINTEVKELSQDD